MELLAIFRKNSAQPICEQCSQTSLMAKPGDSNAFTSDIVLSIDAKQRQIAEIKRPSHPILDAVL